MYFQKIRPFGFISSARTQLEAKSTRGTLTLIQWDLNTSNHRWKYVVTLNKPRNGVSNFTGYAPTLYLAGQKGLQCLFSQRRMPVYQLMKILEVDQVMLFISN